MSHTGYVLGQTEGAARRLELQDRHFAAPSESLLDALALRPDDRVVELGCGPGGFTRRILRRLGPDGVVRGVDSSAGLLEEANRRLKGTGSARFESVQADVSVAGPWLDGVTVLVGRAVLHHVPMAEFLLGRLRTVLPSETRIGFLEPDFRRPLVELARAHATRPELAPLLVFAKAINDLYAAWRISPAVGASLAPALEDAGFADVRHTWHPFPSDAEVLENMQLIYDEVRDTCSSLKILSAAEIEQQKKLIQKVPLESLPPVWGLHGVTAIT